MRTIDIHAHWYPQEWLTLFPKEGAKEGASLERAADGRYHLRAKHITNAGQADFSLQNTVVLCLNSLSK